MPEKPQATASSRWIANLKANPNATLKLFCFPYAGGAAVGFRAWQAGLPSFVEVNPVELPGRGRRLAEPGRRNLIELVREMSEELRPLFDRPFAFFGHSMGAMLGFELARRLRAVNGPQPVHLFVSGRRAPQLSEQRRPTYNLPDAELIDELRRLNGTPAEVLENMELMQFMLPLLRADFEMVQTYKYEPEAPLQCPITAFGGLEDGEENRELIDAWREQTARSFMLRMLPGDHFFLHSSQAMLLNVLSRDLHQLAALRPESPRV